MELRDLEVFVTVATELHFARSAQRLSMSPASVSTIIRSLERDIGAELLARSSRSVRLTAAGSEFLLHAREVLDAAARARASVRPRLRIATGEFHPWPSLVRAAIAAMEVPWRELGEAVPLPWASHRAALGAGDVEAGLAYFVVGQPLPSGLGGIEIGGPGAAGAIVSLDHPLAGKGRVHIDELAAEPMAFLPREANPEFFDAMMAALAADGFRPKLRILSADQQANILQSSVLQMQVNGGWTLAADFLARNPPPGTAGLAVDGLPSARAQLWAIWRRTLDREAQRQMRLAFRSVAGRFDLDR